MSSKGILDVDNDRQLSGFAVLMSDNMEAALETAKEYLFFYNAFKITKKSERRKNASEYNGRL